MTYHRTITRSSREALSFVLSLVWLAGCGDVEWNYESTWWQRPNRVVRPTTTARQPTTQPARADANRPPPPSSPDTPAVPAQPPAGVRKPLPSGRPFYQLYLRSPQTPADTPAAKPEDAEASDPRGEHLHQLRNVAADPCSRLLEMLSVPLGRSGSATECYVLYENASAFEAALDFAPLLDIAPAETAPPGLLDEAAFQAGIALAFTIIEQGAVVDRGLVDECDKRLSTAAQSGTLPARLRWAAAVIGGRLVADYRYDFTTAQTHYRQAERAVAADSLESMTARWWQADALIQEGKPKEARAIYAAILQIFDSKYKKSYIVERAWTTMQKGAK